MTKRSNYTPSFTSYGLSERVSALPDSLTEQCILNESARYRAMAGITFSTEKMAKLADVSLRQLQWWDEKGYVCPSMKRTGCSRRREYSARNALAVMLLAEMRHKGFSLQRIRITLRALTRFVTGDLADLMAGREDLYLVIDDRGKRFHFTTLKDKALNYVVDSPRPAIVIPIHPMVKAMLHGRETQ